MLRKNALEKYGWKIASRDLAISAGREGRDKWGKIYAKSCLKRRVSLVLRTLHASRRIVLLLVMLDGLGCKELVLGSRLGPKRARPHRLSRKATEER